MQEHVLNEASTIAESPGQGMFLANCMKGTGLHPSDVDMSGVLCVLGVNTTGRGIPTSCWDLDDLPGPAFSAAVTEHDLEVLEIFAACKGTDVLPGVVLASIREALAPWQGKILVKDSPTSAEDVTTFWHPVMNILDQCWIGVKWRLLHHLKEPVAGAATVIRRSYLSYYATINKLISVFMKHGSTVAASDEAGCVQRNRCWIILLKHCQCELLLGSGFGSSERSLQVLGASWRIPVSGLLAVKSSCTSAAISQDRTGSIWHWKLLWRGPSCMHKPQQ
jgi:hypothetical protein